MLDIDRTADNAIHLPARENDTERARVMMRALGDRMIDALARLDTEQGAALGCALRDFVLSGEVEPAWWPLDEAIAILSRAPQDRRSAAVLHALRRLRDVAANTETDL